MQTFKRRDFLTASALAAGGAFLTSRLAFASSNPTNPSRFVCIILRGALDGIAAVPPYGDRDYAGLRREIALHAPGSAGGVLPLNGLFGLHPSLTFLEESFGARELIVFHAVASPYRERSHFDGQDVLEGGYTRPHELQSGWLNRALAAVPGAGRPRDLGVALGQNIPLVMRGPAAVTSWSPSKLTAVDEETLERITDLYASDPLLSMRLADALNADSIAGKSAMGQSDMRAAGGPRYAEIIHAAAGFLRRDDGPRVGVFDTTGWDTHANEGSAEGQLAGRLGALDSALRTLKEELGPTWKDTAVLLVTEFGRTAAINGTRGTDHGTGTVAFLVGGAVQGGRVVADWPGLSSRRLYQGRDLQPTLDLRSVLKGVLEEHLLVPPRAVESSVFPDSSSVKPLTGLVRT
jgi:uncharacterized protein (DUF1501 family)